MKIEFDATRDVLNVTLRSDLPVADSREAGGMVFEYAADRSIVAIAIQGARQRINTELLKVIDQSERRLAA